MRRLERASLGRAVSMAPGTTQLAVILSAARSCASAAREADQRRPWRSSTWARCLEPICALMPPMLMMVPPFLLQRRQAGLDAVKRAVERDVHHLAPFGVGHLRRSASRARSAALLTRMSMRPNFFSAASASACDGLRIGDVAEHGHAPCRRPLRFRATTASASALFERTLTTTAAPASASASAMARPILRPAPVTMATLPASSLLSLMCRFTLATRQIDWPSYSLASNFERGAARAPRPSRRGAH